MQRAQKLTLLPLLATIFFCVSGGPYGLEPVMQSGAGIGLLLIVLTPIIWSLPAALLTAELGSAIPAEGGYYVWTQQALGPLAATLCGWWSWIYTWVDAAIYPTLFVSYLSALLKILNVPWAIEGLWLKWAIGLIVVLPFTALNIVGIKSVGRATALFTVLLLVPFVLVVVIGMPTVSLRHLQPLVLPGQAVPGAFAAGLFVVMWNYLGFDSISTVMGEVENPQKILPKTLAISLVIATAAYLLPTIVGLCVLPAGKAWDAGAWPEVARRIGGTWLQIGVAVTGLIGACGLFAATLLTASRIPMMLARDGLLPKALGEVHPKTETPLKAVLVSAFFYTLLSLETFKQLAALDVVLYSAGLCLELVSLVVLRKKLPDLVRPFKIPGGIAAVWVVLLVPIALIIFAIISQFYDPDEGGRMFVISSIVSLGSGFVVYGLYKTKQKKTNLPAT